MRLKTKTKSERYPATECAASRCHDEVAVIDGTGKVDAGPVPYCDRHWTERCEDAVLGIAPTENTDG